MSESQYIKYLASREKTFTNIRKQLQVHQPKLYFISTTFLVSLEYQLLYKSSFKICTSNSFYNATVPSIVWQNKFCFRKIIEHVGCLQTI